MTSPNSTMENVICHLPEEESRIVSELTTESKLKEHDSFFVISKRSLYRCLCYCSWYTSWQKYVSETK
ncbi:unnamed protein product [Brassica oleracea var. botrytis]|uniref:(rape) hypothetical protein n=1 Tax=Brassica napus TaxID=3708 RepID=A0A816KBZ7_BRANA|nr:unnamed protein product [Brassica napus]